MKRFLFAVMVVAVLAPVVAGLAAAELPPIIDRQLIFGDPEISGSQLSPDGKFISFLKPYNDVRNVFVKGIDEPFDAARPVTADERPVLAYFWSQDGKYVLYVQDKDGDENWHVYSVDPTAAPDADTGVPAATDLTPIDGITARIYSVPEKKPDQIIVGLNDRDATYHDVYLVSISTGERTLLIENTEEVGAWFYDLDGNVRIAYRQTEDGGAELLRVEGTELVSFYTTTTLEMAFPIRFHKDGKRVYMQTNKGDDVDLSRLVLLDPVSGELEVVESDPENQVDFGGAIFDETTDELIGTYYEGDRQRIYPRDEKLDRDLQILRKSLPDGELGWNSRTEDMRYHLVSASRDVDPGSVYLYDREKQTVALLYRSRPDLPSEHLAPMRVVRYQARDGLEIPALLTLPKGVEAKNLPTVIYPHGGPWARDSWGYDPMAQFLANRGYAVLQPNFRSTTGYGKNFMHVGDRTWGTGAMQHDITDGVEYLIAEGIADPNLVGIMGGSYGGYATLAGVTWTPELYACAVPIVAPSSIVTMIESFPAYWRPFLKGSWYQWVGDPEVPEDRQDLEARSPINFVDNIRVPLLVVHGANDPRVKQSESDRIVAVLRDKGMPVEYLVAPDEGHGYRAPENRLAMSVATERFLAKHLGGRQQDDVAPEIATKLEAITVDPATVILPGAGAATLLAAAKTDPLPELDGSVIQPATLSYAVTMDMGGSKMDMSMTRSIQATEVDGRACWRVIDTAETPMGKATDAFDLDQKTLAPVTRDAGGMGTIKLDYSETAISGEMGGMGQSLAVDQSLEAPVMADGPGYEVTLAALPLAEGYETTLRYFEPIEQKIRFMKLVVTGKETTEVPAGSFETFLVEITPLDENPSGTGAVVLMADAPHHVVKAEYKLPAMMGGGTYNAELTGTGGAAEE